jgi:tetratricopeptide (TPR) repeat protein
MLDCRRLSLLAVLITPIALGAQTATTVKEPLKQRPVVVRMRAACAESVMQSAAPTEDQRRDARELAQRARQSAILGDATAARSQLRGAASLDPTDANFAYELGRAYEEAGATANAAAEYCRFLSLTPNATEAAGVRERLATLAPPRPDTVVTIAATSFKRAADAYEKGQWIESEAFFDAAIRIDSTSAETYYNRGLVRAIRNERDGAATDFERYLRIRPEASDRPAVVARINSLRAQRISASQAFGLGVIVPGGGQFYTNRPVRGLLSIAAVGTAALFAITSKTTASTTTQSAKYPFGDSTYTYPVTTQHKSRPYLLPGFIAAGGIALVSAIDASNYARSLGSSKNVSLSLGPSAGGIGLFATVAVR